MAPIHNQLEHSIMALGKQAKTLTQKQIEVALSYLATTRHGLRNQVIFLLSTKAGLRAKEIAGLRWSMVVDATGQVGTTDLPPWDLPSIKRECGVNSRLYKVVRPSRIWTLSFDFCGIWHIPCTKWWRLHTADGIFVQW
jgi:integrase